GRWLAFHRSERGGHRAQDMVVSGREECFLGQLISSHHEQKKETGVETLRLKQLIGVAQTRESPGLLQLHAQRIRYMGGAVEGEVVGAYFSVARQILRIAGQVRGVAKVFGFLPGNTAELDGLPMIAAAQVR